MIKKRMRHSRRFQEIINVFLKNGLSHFLYRLGLADRRSPSKEEDAFGNDNLQHIGRKLCLALQDLGPTFIKLGQIASSRRDLIPEEISHELEKLQDHVTPFSFDVVRSIVETELGDTIEQIFSAFNETPLATASIGQVHVAELPTGEKVAVKVQRPEIQKVVETDLAILNDLARFLENNTAWAKDYRLCEIIDEFSSSLLMELNYNIEGRNAERIREQFSGDSSIYIPHIYWEYSTKKVLTMEMIEGIKASDLDALDANGCNRSEVAKKIVESMFHQVLEYGFFHGDPHPGNLYVLPGNVIAYLDFGMVGRLNKELRLHFASLIINLQRGSSKGMIKTFSEMGILHEDTDMEKLQADLDSLQAKYYDVSFQEISLGNVLVELFTVAYHHRAQIPTGISLLSKAVLTLEGLISKLDPSFSIMKAVEPLGKKLIKERYNPINLMHTTLDDVVESVGILARLPQDIKEAATVMRKGKFRLDIKLQQIQTVLKRLDKISNRLSLSIILLSFSILTAGLIIGAAIAGQTTLLWNLPIIEIGSIVATIMFLYLIYSIIKSGRT